MAIQLRRGLAADYDPDKMVEGEAAITTDTNELYIKGSNSVRQLGTGAQTLTATEKTQVKTNLSLGNVADLTYTVVSTF